MKARCTKTLSDVLLKGILDQKGFSKVGAVFWLVLMFQESYCYHACCWVLCCACSCHVMFMSCSCHVPVHVMFIMFRSCHFSMRRCSFEFRPRNRSAHAAAMVKVVPPRPGFPNTKRLPRKHVFGWF